VFWLAPANPAAAGADDACVEFTRPAVQAFARHGIQRVVGISALGRGTVAAKDAGLVTASLAMDDLIAEGSAAAYRAVVCPSFMHNLLRQVRTLAEGAFSGMGRADLPVPLVATTDIAAAAAALLLDASWAESGFGEVPVLGPQDLSPSDMAATLGEVLARPVQYRQLDAEAFAARLASFGTSPGMVAATVAMFHAKNQGMDNAEARTAATATPTTFRQWCQQVLKPAVAEVS
ncbi:MAG: NmrA family transcriptional regulator, partial [Catenulispora sp.]|nr:NmrA family transcriptional regulator [Catenulispora sp.]